MATLDPEDLRHVEHLIDLRAKKIEDHVTTLLRGHFESLTRELGHRLDRLSEQAQTEIKETLSEESHAANVPTLPTQHTPPPMMQI